VIGTALRLNHIGDVKARTPDEILYTREAQIISERGFSAVRELPGKIVPDHQLIGKATYLLLLASAMNISHVYDDRIGAWVSCLASVLSLAALAAIGLRFLSGWAVVYATLALAFCPLALAAARRCWQEALVEVLGVLMLWCACEVIGDHSRRLGYAGIFIVGGSAVLLKQLTAFLLVGTGVFVVALLLVHRAWRPLLCFGTVAIVALVAIVAAFAYLNGGFGALRTLLGRITIDPASNPQALSWFIAFQSGPAYLLIRGLWILMPFNVIVSAAGIALSLVPERYLARFSIHFREREAAVMRLCSWLTVVMLAAIAIIPLSQNYRYLAPIYGPICVLGGIALSALMQAAARRVRPSAFAGLVGLVAVAVVASTISSYQMFDRLFVSADVQDLTIRHVLALPELSRRLDAVAQKR
jgi:4-amino-4-deoxy-L-arabinose transferase-like glycosyltransferase